MVKLILLVATNLHPKESFGQNLVPMSKINLAISRASDSGPKVNYTLPPPIWSPMKL